MVRIEVCYFCSSRIYPGHGIVFARNDSKDTTFDFEKQRNRPIKYDREVMGKTLLAMKKASRFPLTRVKEVQQKREQRFFENRFRGAKAKEKAAIKAEIADNIELIAPAAANREKALLNLTEKARQKVAAAAAKARTAMETTD
ncbi:unnamed protein product [Discosporangium mesarthrocarpum]